MAERLELYFHAHGCDTLVAYLDGCNNQQEILNDTSRCIKAFCNAHDYKIPYWRMIDDYDRTWFDVGSHSEFFFVKPPLDIKMFDSNQEFNDYENEL